MLRGSLRSRVAVLLIAALAASLMLVPSSALAAVGLFSDDDGSVHETAIEALAREGITKGCGGDLFCPRGTVTRGEMAAFLVRALDLPAASSVEFSDDDDSVFEGDIERLAAAGVTKGCSADRFCPDAAVTREQMAAFLHRALDDRLTAGDPIAFTDVVGSTFVDDIAWLSGTGVTKGCADDRFCPHDPVTREQMATFLVRALGLETVPLYPIGWPTEDDVALVERFHVYDDTDEPTDVYQAAYWPRSFTIGLDVDATPGGEGWQVDRVDDAGAYRGWDVLSPPNHRSFDGRARDDDWLQFTLTRPAQVAVAWRDDSAPPSWLAGWSESTGVRIDGDNARVYLRDFPAGVVKLGTVEAPSGENRTMYTVLLAEADGTPTPVPPVPAGQAYPAPGTECPAWAHDRFTTVGPDGKTYQTWHPQWDPVYWCSFGHEHGSDPSLIPGAPMVPYGYVADKVPQDESNPGFKEFIFRDMSDQYWVRFVAHAHTAMQRRVCAQHHTLYVMVYDDAGTELMNVGFKADYGRSVRAETNTPLTPTNCGVSLPAYDDDRERQINVAGDDHNYETWDSMDDTTQTRNLGFGTFRHAFDIRNPSTQCVNATCNTIEPIDRGNQRGENGTQRTLSMARYDGGFVFTTAQALSGAGGGEFFTDPYGNGLVNASASNATRQFIDPAVSSVDFLGDPGDNRIDCKATEPWTFRYTCISIGDGDSLGRVPNLGIMDALSNN